MWMVEDRVITSIEGFMTMERLQLNHSYNMLLKHAESQKQTFISYSMYLSLIHKRQLLQHHKNFM